MPLNSSVRRPGPTLVSHTKCGECLSFFVLQGDIGNCRGTLLSTQLIEPFDRRLALEPDRPPPTIAQGSALVCATYGTGYLCSLGQHCKGQWGRPIRRRGGSCKSRRSRRGCQLALRHEQEAACGQVTRNIRYPLESPLDPHRGASKLARGLPACSG